jgi:DivIVA domain-containing protein
MTLGAQPPEDFRSGEITFRRSLRGYLTHQVDPLLRLAEQIAMSDDRHERAAMARTLRDTEFRVVWGGYDRGSVDAYTEMLRRDYLLAADQPRPGEPGPEVPARPQFTVVLRGYHMRQVDDLVDRAQVALRSGDPGQRAGFRAQLATRPEMVLRGYDREQVDAYLVALDHALQL